MAKQSAGLLMYRRREGSWQVLLVHPGGPFWARKDEGAWTIPKGEIEEGEDAFDAARREFEEETGCATAEGEFRPLNPVRLRSRKTVRAWAFEGDWDPDKLKSLTFALEWPPHSGRVREYPEADGAAWFSIDEARWKIQAGQIGFLDDFEEMARTVLAEG